MGIVNVIENIKQIHPKDITLVGIGKFYYCYGKDAYILSYIFKYKIIKIKDYNIYSCSFPKQSYSKVISKLENSKLNYIILDKKNNYEIDEKSDNKNLNTYDKWYEKAHKFVNIRNRMDTIYKYVLDNIENVDIKYKISKMEDIINETGEV